MATNRRNFLKKATSILLSVPFIESASDADSRIEYHFALIGIKIHENDSGSFEVDKELRRYGFAETSEVEGTDSDDVYKIDKTGRFCLEEGIQHQILRIPGETYVGEIIYEGLTQKTLPQDLEQRLERVKKDFLDARVIQGSYWI